MTRPTPGPWQRGEPNAWGGWNIYDGDPDSEAMIAHTVARGDDEDEETLANALLITAAPQLLAALKMVLSRLVTEDSVLVGCPEFRLGKEAIYAAEGRESA